MTDTDIQSSVIEIMGTNVSTNYVTCPTDSKKTLSIKLPFLVMIIKNVSAKSQTKIILTTPLLCLKIAEEILYI